MSAEERRRAHRLAALLGAERVAAGGRAPDAHVVHGAVAHDRQRVRLRIAVTRRLPQHELAVLHSHTHTRAHRKPHEYEDTHSLLFEYYEACCPANCISIPQHSHFWYDVCPLEGYTLSLSKTIILERLLFEQVDVQNLMDYWIIQLWWPSLPRRIEGVHILIT